MLRKRRGILMLSIDGAKEMDQSVGQVISGIVVHVDRILAPSPARRYQFVKRPEPVEETHDQRLRTGPDQFIRSEAVDFVAAQAQLAVFRHHF